MKIYVRRRHIEKGKMGRIQKCPVALAFKEAAGGGPPPRVTTFSLYTPSEHFVLPRIAQRFIARFDAGKPVKPFAFVLK